MKSKKLSAQRPGNRSNSSASNGSCDDLTTRNVEIIKQLEDAAKQERTKSDLVAEAIANFCGSMTFVWVHVGWFGCACQKLNPAEKSWKFVVLTVNLAGHESCPIVGSFYVALVLPNLNKYAD